MYHASIPSDGNSKRSSNQASVLRDADLRYIDAVAKWCQCLQSKQSLTASLRELALALRAMSAVVSRHSREPVCMAQVIGEPDTVASSPEADRSYARCVLGAYIDRPRVGSVWLSSLADERNDPALLAFQKRAGVAETVVVPLAVEDKRIDYLELHFEARLDKASLLAFDIVADALSRIWATRSPGLFSAAVSGGRGRRAAAPVRGGLLSTANPARLSRAEFRICLLLSRGLSRTAIYNELSISPATFRTHLRNILRKVGTPTLEQLLFVLLTPSSAGEIASHLHARVA